MRALWLCLALLAGQAALGARPADVGGSLRSETAGHADQLSSSQYTKEARADAVESLPGWGSLASTSFNLFAG